VFTMRYELNVYIKQSMLRPYRVNYHYQTEGSGNSNTASIEIFYEKVTKLPKKTSLFEDLLPFQEFKLSFFTVFPRHNFARQPCY